MNVRKESFQSDQRAHLSVACARLAVEGSISIVLDLRRVSPVRIVPASQDLLAREDDCAKPVESEIRLISLKPRLLYRSFDYR